MRAQPGRLWDWLLRLAIVVLALGLAPWADAAECRKVGTRCTDGPSTKNISGAMITKSCWKYEDTYECADTSGSPIYNYCAPLETAGCTETSNTCTETAFNGACTKWTKNYRCGNSIGNPAGTIELDDTYTFVSANIDNTPCESLDDNASCTLAETVCIEGPETRTEDGVAVFQSCWKYEKRYSCSSGEYANYCSPLQAEGCVETGGATCALTTPYGACVVYDRTYTCNAKMSEPLPTSVTYLDSSYTLVGDGLDLSQCTTLENNPNCTYSGRTCVEGPDTRNVDGLDVYKDCWRYEDTYVCASTTLVSNCAELQGRSECAETSTPLCVDELPGGQCGVLEHTYECNIGGSTTSSVTNCGTQTFCIDGSCFDSGYSPDTDFGLAITNMEAIREAASYGLFVGEENECHKNMLVNCCKSEGGGQGGRNDSIASEIGSAAFTAGSEVIQVWGSRYVFEGLMNSGSEMLAEYAMGALGSGSLAMTGTFTVWGAEFSVAAEGIAFVGFDPTSLAISIAIYFIMQMMQCEEEEQALAMKRGQGLCHKVGSYCAHKVFGACITKKEGWCCFPSKLGRIVNEQGRAQIGKGWGSAKHPDCSGFTTAQLALLRFDEMDLSEFIRDITPSSKTSSYAIERLSTQAASYY
jgi:conjugal transfer mating pair stabilization protein TraN